MTYETVAIQTATLPDGRVFIADREIFQLRAEAFIERYRHYWQRDENLCGWVSPTIDLTPAPKQIAT